MVFRVKYLDKKALEDSIEQHKEDEKHIHSNRLTSPIERNFNWHFTISKDIEVDTYKVIYNDKRINGLPTHLIIEAGGELIFPDAEILTMYVDKSINETWSKRFNKKTFLEKFDILLNDPKFNLENSYNEDFYSWDSIMDRIDIFEKTSTYDIGWNQGWKEVKEIDKVIQREFKINNLLK